jgi:hypothetical protein
MGAQPNTPNREFEEIRVDLERVVGTLRAFNLDHKSRKKLLRELRELLAEADRLLG